MDDAQTIFIGPPPPPAAADAEAASRRPVQGSLRASGDRATTCAASSECSSCHASRSATIRAVFLGGLITLVFTAANVYLGLRVGLTFATSIPAAVISMAVLRLVGGSNILENNIVQTIASAAGTLAAIIFVLPGLVIIGWWNGFPYWTTALATAAGGILGVMFSVPLRRALVVDTPLPYPEGVAAAEVLKVGAGSKEGDEENKLGLRLIIYSSVSAGLFTIISKTRLLAEEVGYYFHAGASSTGVSGGLSYALFGAGHLVGLSVGMANFIGMVIGWWILLPILTWGSLARRMRLRARSSGRTCASSAPA